MEELSQLQQRRAILLLYLRAKTDEGDWHGVSDAANDLRVLEETIRCESLHGSEDTPPTGQPTGR